MAIAFSDKCSGLLEPMMREDTRFGVRPSDIGSTVPVAPLHFSYPPPRLLDLDVLVASRPVDGTGGNLNPNYSVGVRKARDVPLETFVDLLLDAIFVVDREGTILFVSAASERILGYSPDEMVGRDVVEFVHPDDRPATVRTIGEILEGQLKPVFENRYMHKDGSTVDIMWSARWSEANQVRVAVARDVTEKKRADSMQAAVYAITQATHAPGDVSAMLRHIHEIVGGLLPATNFCVVLVGPNEKLRTAYLADQNCVSEADRASQANALVHRVIRTGESLLITPDGTDPGLSDCEIAEASGIPNWLGAPLQNPEGTVGALAVYSYNRAPRYTEKDRELLQFVAMEIGAAIERKTMRFELEHLAHHDPLTDLPNRSLVMDRLANALSRAARGNTRFAILYLDLNDFKHVNDTYGHNVGDRLLQEVARRLAGSVRGSDTVGRLGGDEFFVLLESIAGRDNAEAVAEKIRIALTASYDFEGQTLVVAPSIGVAVYPEDGTDEDALIGYADAAMYRTKRQGTREVSGGGR